MSLSAGKWGGRRDRKRAQRMRLVVDSMPYETRVAMLEGLRRYRIIAGAYSSRDGGVCPMLAAHRCGGRTDLRSFAGAWDRFTGVRRRSRRASERELRTLRAQLEASIWTEDAAQGWPSRVRETPAGDALDAHPQIEMPPLTHGEAWLLPARDLDAYLSALRRALGHEPDASSRQRWRSPARH